MGHLVAFWRLFLNKRLPADRRVRNFSYRHLALRLLWNVAWSLLFRFTPKAYNPPRRLLLRIFGAKLGRNFQIHPSAQIWYPPHFHAGDNVTIAARVNLYCMARIHIGDNTIISQGVFLCGGTHDFRDEAFPLICLPILVGSDVWLAAESFVGPGVEVGDGVVLGARSVATRRLSSGLVYAGNPAKQVGIRSMNK